MEITGWRVQRRTTCWEIGSRRSFSGFFARWPFSSNNYPEKEEFVRERKLCLTKIAQQKLIQRSCLGHFTHSSILILIPGVDAMRPDTEKRKGILWDTWHQSDFNCEFSPLCNVGHGTVESRPDCNINQFPIIYLFSIRIAHVFHPRRGKSEHVKGRWTLFSPNALGKA